MRFTIRSALVFVEICLAVALFEAPAQALPIFSQQYGLTCQKCHTDIPAINDFGRVFLDNGYHLPGVNPGPAFPVAVRANVAYTSAPDATGLPKAIVDEVELLSGGTIGPNGNYFAESYLVDGGNHGNLREVWLGEFIGAPRARVPVYARAGQFTLALPVDPETFRETAQHYAVFDQTIGANPFNFFDPKLGIALRVGNGARGTSIEVAALNGHDQQSGLPTVGVDTMTTVKAAMGRFEVTAYRYAGKRATASGVAGFDADRFTRTGAGLRYEAGRWTSESVLQENTDTNANGVGTGDHTSGGFTQLRYAFNSRLFGLARYDGTNDTNGFARSFSALLGMRTTPNSRVSIEDVITHAPTAVHTLNAQFTIAY